MAKLLDTERAFDLMTERGFDILIGDGYQCSNLSPQSPTPTHIVKQYFQQKRVRYAAT